MLRFVLLALISLLSLAPPAWGGTITLVLSDQGSAYSDFSGTLEEALLGTNWSIAARHQANALPALASQTDLVVTVGSEALRKTLGRSDNPPIIATLLPRQSYEKILAEFRRPGRSTAIYLDQPAARQAAFINHLLPGQKRVGMLISGETRNVSGLYRQAFGNAGLTLDGEDADTDSTLLPALNSLLSRVNVLIAVPDSKIYHRSNIKPILITAFRYQRPVIGYSPAFVNAGALAALHSTPAQIARQTAEMIVAHGTNLPNPSGPSQFAIAINGNVAQSLGLNIADEAAIRRAMVADRDAR
jgi:putative tryptophan/tyrosine transport system substrate-binding protein